MGISFGGYLAPRAASGEHRLAACIADPGQYDLFEAIKARLPLPQKTLDQLPNVDPSILQPIFDAILANSAQRWTLKQRALWVHGLKTLFDYVRISPQYSVATLAGEIRCPTLVTQAENDPIAAFAERLYDALTCPKQFLRFTDAEGAGDHCESLARSLFNQRAFDWLDEVLAQGRSR
jgi:pimeloyl-ACP methyl ester carboxylesterase